MIMKAAVIIAYDAETVADEFSGLLLSFFTI